MANVTPAQFKAPRLRDMRYISVIDPAKAACYAKLTAKSNPAATTEYAAEDFAAGYRPGLENITVPLLEISPYYAPDFRRAAARSDRPVTSAKDKAELHRKLLSGAQNSKVVTLSPSRHFGMLDAQQKFLHALEQFLARVAETSKPH